MKLEIDIHPAQAEILSVLIFNPNPRFSDLNQTGLGSDHFAFHLKRLQDVGLVEKTNQQTYRLTAIGKEFANRLDTDEKVIERQAKLGVLLVITRPHNGQTQYLVQQRLKQPFYGYHGFMTGKIRWGEQVLDTAKRELAEETGLTGRLRLAGVYHKTDYSPAGDILEDKYFYVVLVTAVKGDLKEAFQGGKNFWMTTEQINGLEVVFEGMGEAIAMTERDKMSFIERRFTYTESEY
ncbi:NUDIX hydrolase [Candidatus Parcubacteria bacterium]|nr:NUDIX hydrolase [Candidatus Parcubacteria bacterium]